MKNNSTPWDEIIIPAKDYNVRRAVAGSTPIFWGKDKLGNCMFIVEISGDHAEYFRKNNPSMHGIHIDLRQQEGGQSMVLTLGQNTDKDLFLTFCRSLVSILDGITDSAVLLSVALNHIKRWRLFMSLKKWKTLSDTKVRGLVAELQFLRFLYQNRLSCVDAVSAWNGADRFQQDFMFGNTAVEVKSLSGSERNTVRISSESQLDCLCDNLFLVIFNLRTFYDSSHALSLNKIVSSIESELDDSAALEGFSGKISAYGYIPIPEYDTPEFLVTSRNSYHVTDQFPRLLRSQLPSGIVQVRYNIELEHIKPFECDIEQIK